MLSLLRKKAQSPVIQATMVIIALVFIFWGVGTNSRNSERDAVATVNEHPISITDYQQAYDRVISQYRDQFGGSLPEGLIKTLNIRGQVLEQLIQGALLRQGAGEIGLMVSNAEVKQQVREMPVFQNNGAFDMGRYEAVLSNSRLTPATFEESLRVDLLSGKVMDHIGRFAKVAPVELQERFAFDNEEVKLAYAALAAADFKERVEVTEDGLADYFAKNQASYQTAPEVKIKYLAFLFGDAEKELTVTDDEVQQYYQQNLERYSIPEQRRARHILIKTTKDDSEEQLADKRRQAADILQMAKEGGDFAALAKQYSEGPTAPTGGDLGLFSRGRMVKEFEDAVFALGAGQLAEVVQTQFGFHVIKVEEAIPARTKALAEVKDELTARLTKEKAGKITFAKADKAYEQIILAGSLEGYAEQSEVALAQTDFFSRKSSPAGPKSVMADPAFLNAAFALKKGELSSLTELANGYAIIFAEDFKEPQVPLLAEVKEAVTKAYINDRAVDLAKEAAEGLLAGLKAGDSSDPDSFRQAAAELSLEVKETGFGTRATIGSGAELPGSVADQAFRLSAANPYPDAVATADDKFYVFRLLEKREPPPELLAEKREEYQNRLLAEKKTTLLKDWLAGLRDKAEIEINQQFL